MNRVIVNSRIGSDGVLHLDLPIGSNAADRDVRVTVEPLAPGKPMTTAEWHAWVDALAGSWQGEFERPPQGAYEERDPLS